MSQWVRLLEERDRLREQIAWLEAGLEHYDNDAVLTPMNDALPPMNDALPPMNDAVWEDG